jgi:hypothetical protein
MKTNKFYVAIKTSKQDNFTMLLVSNMQTLKGNLPPIEVIESHIRLQHIKVTQQKKQFQPIVLKVSDEAFELIKREIRSKINSRLILDIGSIDIVMDSNTLPVIQIVKEKEHKQAISGQ